MAQTITMLVCIGLVVTIGGVILLLDRHRYREYLREMKKVDSYHQPSFEKWKERKKAIGAYWW